MSGHLCLVFGHFLRPDELARLLRKGTRHSLEKPFTVLFIYTRRSWDRELRCSSWRLDTNLYTIYYAER